MSYNNNNNDFIFYIYIKRINSCLFSGSLAFLFDIHGNVGLVLALIPPSIFLGLCFKIKADHQIKLAAILGIAYAFLMLVVTLSIIGKLVLNCFIESTLVLMLLN